MLGFGKSSPNGRTIHALLAGVRPAHGKMGGRTIQISELLEFTQILLHNLYNLINIPVLIYPGISYYHNYKITIYIYQIFG